MATRPCRTRRLARLAAALAVCSGALIGCSDESAPLSGDDGHSVYEVASSWGEIAPRDEERTRTYLAGDGDALVEYADFAGRLPDRLDDAAYEDGCAALRTEWQRTYAGREMLDWLYELPDPILGRLLTSQIPAVEQALDACAAGDRDRGTESVDQVGQLQELVDRRLSQLGVDR